MTVHATAVAGARARLGDSPVAARIAQDGGRDVLVRDDLGCSPREPSLAERGGHADRERDAKRRLVGKPLASSQAMLTEEDAVVGEEDDDGVGQIALLSKLRHDPTDAIVHLA